jgi:hypothetical protein
MRGHAATLFLTVFVGCSGAGGDSESLPPLVFGLVAADAPTQRDFPVWNPFPGAATVEAAGETGPFRVAEGALPAPAPGPEFLLPVEFLPPSPGSFRGSIALRFVPAGGGGPVVLNVEALATAEAPLPSSLTASLQFGDVTMTTQATRPVNLRNSAFHTGCEIGAPALPAGFSIPGTAFPLRLAAQETRTLDLLYEPVAMGDAGFELAFPHDAAGPALRVAVAATTSGWPEEMVLDLGDVALDANGETPWVEVEVPPSAISVTFEASGVREDDVECAGIEWPDGFAPSLPPWGLQWRWVACGLSSVTLPWTDAFGEQVTPGGGIYRFRFRRRAGPSPGLHVRVLIENRPWAVVSGGVLDLNVFIASGLQTAPGQVPALLQGALAGADSLLATVGLRIGDVATHTDQAPDRIENIGEFHRLLEQSERAVAPRLNVFLVTYLGGGSGLAGAVQGPASNGWATSGVAVVGFDGAVLAHEIGHYLGLHHPFDGDAITDTPTTLTANNLMNTPAPATTLTLGQGHVILRHPLVRAP